MLKRILRFRKKLSRLDVILLLLTVMLLIGSLALFFNTSQIRKERDEVAAQVKRAAIALKEVNPSAKLDELKQEKAKLQAEMATILSPTQIDSSELTMQLWQWASQSGVELSQTTYSSGKVKLGDLSYDVLKYTLQAVGEPHSLAKFIKKLDSSPYAPVVDTLNLAYLPPSGPWKANLSFTIYTLSE
ncbi:MAG: hypothetical protein DRI26_04155 [Chloroflexi bacterium]|nr:MAG: hypothetical protein DRI26_04155 [Chloroflexota bacterium]